MITLRRIALALFAALLLAFPLPGTATAQDLDATTTALQIADLTGVEAAVSRSYALDIGDIINRIEAGEPPAETIEGPILLTVVVASFDTPEHAADAVGAIEERLAQEPPITSIPMEVEPVDDLGDLAISFSGTRETGASPVTVAGFAVQDDIWLYLSMVVSEDDSSAEAARDLIEFGLNRSPSSQPETYVYTGRSTGGIWEKIPGENSNRVLANAQPIYDYRIVIEPAD